MFRRLPSYFPNLSLKLLPLTEAEQKAFKETGFLKRLVFRVAPSTNKVGVAAVPAVRACACARVQSRGWRAQARRCLLHAELCGHRALELQALLEPCRSRPAGRKCQS